MAKRDVPALSDPAETDPASQLPPTPTPGPRWLYTGPGERVYTTIPVTVVPGAVLAWPTIPAGDGCWEPTEASDSVVPDNARVV
jgi:hypothetical protein